MSALAEQHDRHQVVRNRLWGTPTKRRPIVVPPEQTFAPKEPIPFAGSEDVPPDADWVPFNFCKPSSPRAIIKLVSLKHGVGVRDIISNDRFPRVVAARHHAIWLVHTHCPWLSIPDVGRIFDRDHTTILYVISKVTGKRERADG